MVVSSAALTSAKLPDEPQQSRLEQLTIADFMISLTSRAVYGVLVLTHVKFLFEFTMSSDVSVTHLPQRVSQSVLHTTPSILRSSTTLDNPRQSEACC